jgi:hypothetical protein
MEFLHFFYIRRKKIADSTKSKRKLNTIAYILDYKSKTELSIGMD